MPAIEWRYIRWTQVFDKILFPQLCLFPLDPKIISCSVCVFSSGARLIQLAKSIVFWQMYLLASEMLHCEMVFLRALTDCHINLMQHYAAGVYSWPPLRAAP